MNLKTLQILSTIALSACASLELLEPAAIKNTSLYPITTYPPLPDWYNGAGKGWIPYGRSLYHRSTFDLGPSAAMLSELYLEISPLPEIEEAFLNGVKLPAWKKNRLGIQVPEGTLKAKENLLAIRFKTPQAAPKLGVDPVWPKGLYISAGPYLLPPSENTAAVAFQTSTPCRARLFTENLSTEETKSSTLHRLQLTSLTPRSRYSYQVSCQDERQTITSHKAFLSTAGQDSIRISLAVLPRDNEAAAALSPDLVIPRGLLPNGTDLELWNAFFQQNSTLLAETPIAPILSVQQGALVGLTQAGEKFWLPDSKLGPGRAYSFDHGSSHFVLIDTSAMIAASDWIKADLQKAKDKRKIVIVSSQAWPRPTRKEVEKRIPSVDAIILLGSKEELVEEHFFSFPDNTPLATLEITPESVKLLQTPE